MCDRNWLDAVVAARAQHDTADRVGDTLSFARAERLIGREYHGRFLIELLQNAADAWREDPRSDHEAGARLIVRLVEDDAGPVLVVANQGIPMTPKVVIDSLGKIGASTKQEGEAIGHKGIGFKSVLEITRRPKIYSGLKPGEPPSLAVEFDPDRALKQIKHASLRWGEWVQEAGDINPADPVAAIPVLRFPHWIDEPPLDVGQLAAAGFDTVVRLPFDPQDAARLATDRDGWIEKIQKAIAELSDEILILLGCFAEVQIENRLTGAVQVIVPRAELADPGNSGDTLVTVKRDGETTSRYWLARQTLPEGAGLAGEIAVGIRLDRTGDDTGLLSAGGDTHPSAPFHLFFPTHIPSGLPFLLHGYFEVDVGRTGFYRGSELRNRAILEALASLAAETLDRAAAARALDLTALVNLMARAAEPEDPLAHDFRTRLLAHLDDKDWVPVSPVDGQPERNRPARVLVAAPPRR